MDGSTIEHNSDSDSGESWTILEEGPAYGDVAPELSERTSIIESRDVPNTNIEKDEDTDGISIISDSDPETIPPCEISYETFIADESRPSEQHDTQYISVNPLPSNNTNVHESVGSKQDFLGDSHGKHKTYVHRRNKRLSTVLNIIMLGSVITAAGVAIGHMWGAKHECAVQTTPSINKILSNLYKLQEENAYLRSKLKELTLATNIQMLQKKADKLPYKHRCKKVYEEALNNKNADKAIKCLDSDRNPDTIIASHLVQPEYEKEFLHDMNKLKVAYQQNKSWLDDEVTRRLKNEEHSMKRMKNSLKSTNLIKIEEEQKEMNLIDLTTPESESIIESEVITQPLVTDPNTANNLLHINFRPNKKISYADSLKSYQQGKSIKKREANDKQDKVLKDLNKKPIKKNKKNEDIVIENSASEPELTKDDRYVGHKSKQERKKHDRQKLHKKQKRKNKYDIWDIKGDIKDYDELSFHLRPSLQENNFILVEPDKNLLRDFEKTHYINPFSEADKSVSHLENVDTKGTPDTYKNNDKLNKKGDRNKQLNWYENRAALRTEARKRLEHELFGETSPNNASWYFRRVQRREQCRAKGNNSTHRKLSKRSMNYKVKH